MIEVKNLTKHYGRKTAVNNISFSVKDGEILGFLGPNGAGKSTTMNIITGYLSSSDGTVTVDGKEILEDPKGVKSRIGYLPEQPPLYFEMTVKEYLSFVYDLKKIKRDKWAHIGEVCGLVGVEEMLGRRIKNLSKGYRQRVGLAQALLGYPKLLILDEPTVGLDPKQIIEIRDLIRGLGEKHTIILSSHILSEVKAICDRVIVISDGILVADDTTDALSQSLSATRQLRLRIDGPEAQVLPLLRGISGVEKAEPLGEVEKGSRDYMLDVAEGADVRRAIFRQLGKKDWPLIGLEPSQLSLEDVFLQLTQKEKAGESTGDTQKEEAKAE